MHGFTFVAKDFNLHLFHVQLGFPIQACVAAATNHWRKPHTSMWDFFVKTMRKGAAVDMKESVFVGDAAGRPAGWKVNIYSRSKSFF